VSERIQLSIENGIASVRLNRPDKRNALDLAMFQAIAASQKQLARMRELRAVILSGAGPDFCSGLDIKSVMGDRRAAIKLMWKWLPWRANLAQQVNVGWRKLPVPVIVSLHGRCWGGGLQIALGGDFRVAHTDASLSVMEAKWGLIPDMGGTLALRDVMARDQALKLVMTAETVNARQALELGLVTAVSENPESACMELATTLQQRSPDAIAAAKRLYLKSWGGSGRILARESLYQLRILAGTNQRIATRRARGEPLEYEDPGRW
jgi:enoyl-CoA hydratase/carnithine racemase